MNYTIFFAGITMATFAAAGLFFLKLWIASRDRLFIFFAGACWLLSLERVAGILVQGILDPVPNQYTEANSWIYFIRLLAFGMIMIAVIEKNVSKNGR